MDEAIGGGLPKSAITELTSPNLSAGRHFSFTRFLQNAHRRGFFLGLSRWQGFV